MNFDAKDVSKKIIDFIKKYYKENNLKGAVIGISGGKDSAVVSALFTKALGKENVCGIWMPCHSKNSDKKIALSLSKQFGFKLIEFDLTMIYDLFIKQIYNSNYTINKNNLVDANINIKPRLRMVTLYYFASLLSNLHNGTYIVPGTSNKCEMYVGYFTKGGDNIADIHVLLDLTVEEVIAVGKEVGVPEEILLKVPDDGLSGKIDEDKLGVKYSEITKVLNNDYDTLDKKTIKKINILHAKNKHKLNVPIFTKK